MMNAVSRGLKNPAGGGFVRYTIVFATAPKSETANAGTANRLRNSSRIDPTAPPTTPRPQVIVLQRRQAAYIGPLLRGHSLEEFVRHKGRTAPQERAKSVPKDRDPPNRPKGPGRHPAEPGLIVSHGSNSPFPKRSAPGRILAGPQITHPKHAPAPHPTFGHPTPKSPHPLPPPPNRINHLPRNPNCL